MIVNQSLSLSGYRRVPRPMICLNSTMELIGVPTLIVVGPKGVKAGVVEVRDRKSGKVDEMSLDAAIKRVTAAKVG